MINFEDESTPSKTQEEADMNLKQFAASSLIATTALTGTACKPITELVADRNSAGQVIKTGNDFKITQNANPKKGYLLNINIKDAPVGGFKRVNASVGFNIENIKDCGYFLGGSFQGTVPGVSDVIDFPITKISDTEYEAKFYTDWAVDGDFFGKGVCHWVMSNMTIGFSATGADGETHFVTGFYPEELQANKPQVKFYLKQFYPTYPPLPNMPDFGIDTEAAKQHPPSNLFSITLTTQELK